MASTKQLMKNPAVSAALAGAAAQFAAGFSPYGAGAATVAVGYATKNQFAQSLGGYQLGAVLAGSTGLAKSNSAGLL